MNTALLKRSLLYSIPILLIILALLASSWLEDNISLSAGRVALLDQDYQKAEKLFESILGSYFYGSEAELGFVISKLMQSSADVELLYISRKANAGAFALNMLLRQQLLNGNYPKCLELTTIVTNYQPTTARLYQAACYVELHQFNEARTITGQLLPRQLATELGRRILSALSWNEKGYLRVIRDRHGNVIASINADGEYRFTDERYANLVQPTIRRAINRYGRLTNIRLSLDIDLSLFAWKILDGRRGSIVLLQPKTNQVLVAVSDEETADALGKGSSPAFEQQLEPASISKLITTVAAMRDGIDPDERLNGLESVPAKRYQGGILYNPSQLGILSGLNQAMAGSCNVAFAELGNDVGWHKLVAELKNFGFDGHSGNPFDLGHILKDTGSERELADMSIGLEHTEITPLHCALVASVFANEGMWQEPEFIIAEDGLLGYSPQPVTPSGDPKPIVKKEWLPTLYSAMRAVTGWHGTARGISPKEFPVAMKTGTGGGGWTNGFHVNYIGFGPYPDAEAIFAVRVTNVRRSRDVRRMGYVTTRQLLLELKRRSVARSLD